MVCLQRWHGWCRVKLLPSRRVLCTLHNHAPRHVMQSQILESHACLAAFSCHLHFWQNDRDLLRANAVTRGWNGCRNKIQHRKLTLEKKILPPLLQGFEPATCFKHESGAVTTELSPLPRKGYKQNIIITKEHEAFSILGGNKSSAVDDRRARRSNSIL